MAADGKVVFEITADDAPLKKTVNQTESWLKKLDLGNIFDFSIGSMLADAVGNIGTALKDFATESVGLASDLQEVQNVVDVTFGSDAKTIETWSKKANKQFGLTELQAKKYTSTLGAMMKSSGLTGKAVTSMSTDLAGLAAEMASFYNLDFETAFEKIRSGISGETEPLKQLGINMSVANLEAYALSQGIDTAYESMTQAEQVTLRYNYLMQATSDAQGDFARTSDSLANSQRILSTNLDTLKANIGEALLPVINSAVGAVNDLFAALTPEVDIMGTFDQIEADYTSAVEEINSKEFTALGLVDELEKLQSKTTLTADEQNIWNATLQKLVETVPELSDLINLQTGELLASTDAIREQTEAWAESAENDALTKAVEAKRTELANLRYDVATSQVEYTASWKKWRAAEDERLTLYNDLAEAAGKEKISIDQLMAGQYDLREIEAGLNGQRRDDLQTLVAMTQESESLNAETAALRETFEAQTASYEEGAARMEEIEAAYYDTADAQNAAASAAEQNAGALEQEQAAVQGQLEFLQSGAIEEALEAMQAYEEGVRESIRGTLDGVAGVFDEIGKVNERSAESLMSAVNSQLEYWQDYETNLTTLKDRFAQLGISEAIIDQFADGSLESAGIMAGMVEMSDTELQNLAATAGEVDGIKETIVGELTETRLGLDSEYQTMEEEFDELIASFNQQEAARANVAATATGVTSELSALYEDVSSLVSAINSTMAGTGKSLSFSTPKRVKTLIDGSNADGLDYVPFDGYISELHKGEAVLTAREAEVWRTGGASINYEALASAVWASAPRDLFAGMPAPQVNVEVGLNGENLVAYVSTQQQLGLQSYNMSKWQPR